jgi:hypothetical protein
MDKMGWLADRRTRRLAWLGGVVLTVTAVVAVFAVLRPTSDSRDSASTRRPDRAAAHSTGGGAPPSHRRSCQLRLAGCLCRP